MELPERIATIIKVNQHTAATFADAIGVQRSSISHILNGRNKPSLDLLEKILLHFPRVDAAWLITGRVQRNSASRIEREPEIEEKRMTALSSESISKGEWPDDLGVKMSTIDLGKDRVAPNKPATAAKTIEKIIICYSDRTFATYESQ